MICAIHIQNLYTKFGGGRVSKKEKFALHHYQQKLVEAENRS